MITHASRGDNKIDTETCNTDASEEYEARKVNSDATTINNQEECNGDGELSKQRERGDGAWGTRHIDANATFTVCSENRQREARQVEDQTKERTINNNNRLGKPREQSRIIGKRRARTLYGSIKNLNYKLMRSLREIYREE